jgi:hypothetical protein
MIIYDQTVSARPDNVNEALINIKAKLGFTNAVLDSKKPQDNPTSKIPNFSPDLLFQLVSLLTGPPIPDASSLQVPYAKIAYGFDPNWGRGKPGKPGPWACTQGTSVWLFDRWVNGKDTNPERRAAVLAHELVHVLCGNELDSEITENVMFLRRGATIDLSDVYSFRSKHWRGRWFRVVRNAKTKKIEIRYGWNSSIGSNIVDDLKIKLTANAKMTGSDIDKLLNSVPVE